MKTVLPEINFLNTNPEEITREVISTYEEIEGRKLADGDPLRIIFLAMASVITKLSVNINDAAKQNLLYYSRGKVLDHKGDAWSTPRLGNKRATSKIRFHMSRPQPNANIIKKNTLLTTDSADIIFRTISEVVIKSMESYVDVDAECIEPGVIGNGLGSGEINTLIVPIAYISGVENLTITSGGANVEEDKYYRARVRQSPEKLSTTGPDGAYEYFARSASSDISDVKIDSTSPGVVDIKILLKDGKLPTEEIIKDVYSAVSSRKVRPLTDTVEVGSPNVVDYDLDMSFYINAHSTDKTLIQTAVEKSIEDWIIWQSSKIGRDINPSKLIGACIEAGAKRVDVRSPEFRVIDNSSVSQINIKTITFGGTEDD